MLTFVIVGALIAVAVWAYMNVQKVSARDLAEANSAGTKPQTFALARSAYIVAPALIAGILERALVRSGFTVHRAEDVREAAAYLLRNAVPLLVVDVATASLEDTIALRQLVPVAKLVLITGEPLDDAHAKLLSATGAVGVLPRPFNEDSATTAIAAAEAAEQRGIPAAPL
jgi:ActR/RegA family two-component response regulator